MIIKFLQRILRRALDRNRPWSISRLLPGFHILFLYLEPLPEDSNIRPVVNVPNRRWVQTELLKIRTCSPGFLFGLDTDVPFLIFVKCEILGAFRTYVPRI